MMAEDKGGDVENPIPPEAAAPPKRDSGGARWKWVAAASIGAIAVVVALGVTLGRPPETQDPSGTKTVDGVGDVGEVEVSPPTEVEVDPPVTEPPGPQESNETSTSSSTVTTTSTGTDPTRQPGADSDENNMAPTPQETNETSTTPPTGSLAPSAAATCIMGNVMYHDGDSLGHIRLECINATSYVGNVCGPEGQIIEAEEEFTCPGAVPYCVQCGPRGSGAALCLPTPTTNRDCGDGETGETVAEPGTEPEPEPGPDDVVAPQVYKARYLRNEGPIETRVKIADPSVAEGYSACAEMETDMTNAIKHYANKIIMQEVRNDWYEKCDPNSPLVWNGGGLYAPTMELSVEDSAVAAPPPKADGAAASVTATAGKAPEDSFETNNQVDGVDEADVAKSDGERVYAAYGDLIYVWNATDGTRGMSITKMPFNDTKENCNYNPPPPVYRPPILVPEPVPTVSAESIKGASSSSAPGGGGRRRDVRRRASMMVPDLYWDPCHRPKPRILSLLLDGPRLTAIVSESKPPRFYPYTPYTKPLKGEEEGSAPDIFPEPVIEDDTKLTLRVYDVSDVPTNGDPLTLLAEREIAGNYNSARSVGSTGYVVTTSRVKTGIFANDLYRHNSQYCGLDSEEYQKLAVKTALKNTAPFMRRMVGDLQLQLDGTCRGIFQVAAMQSGNSTQDNTGGDLLGQFVQVLSFDMSSDFANGTIPVEQGAAFSSGYMGNVYASQDFVATLNTGSSYNPATGRWDQSTFIRGFDISGAKPEPFAYANIPGTPLNQYATDLYDGHLRVTTQQNDWRNKTSRTNNRIFVLGVPQGRGEGSEMELVGQSGHIGKPNESLFAVRYIGDKAYIVTFERTDPFYIYDLSNHKPEKLGELEIPGYSSYLHPITLDGVPFMLGVGQHADETTGRTVGLKVSLFDVSDPSSPTENATHVDLGAYSNTESDFKSFRWLEGSEKLIIPRRKNGKSPEGSFDGFVVFNVASDAITPTYQIKHASSHDIFHGCWYGASMPPRSFVFKSKLTTIRSHSVISTDLESGEGLWSVNLDEGLNVTDCRSYWGW